MGKIQIGINLEFVRHEDKSFEWGVKKAAELGYEYVEPMVHWGRELLSEAGYFHSVSMLDDPLRLSRACAQAGIKMSGLSTHTPITKPEIGDTTNYDLTTAVPDAKVTMLPGTYVIKDGTLQVKNTSQLVGENVGFFFTGTFNLLIVKLGSSFFFDPDTVISLTAPKQGEMAGLLFYGSRSLPNATISTILSNNAQVLLGTIYMPTSSLVIDSAAQVGHQSAYTAIVARRVVLMSGPDLVLNTNYDRSDVPVPAGIRGAGQGVSLVK